MDGMILAAGLGTRLRPLTERTPKALIAVAGVPMLERVARRLISAGVDRLIINVHHHAGQIVEFVESRNGFGVEVRFAPEPDEPLETGGGLKNARAHFRSGSFLLHNVDVISDIDLTAMVRAHEESEALATLAVQRRPAKRFLRFDSGGLQARVNEMAGTLDTARPERGPTVDRAFAGIHVVESEIFDLLLEEGVFSILVPYLRLAGEGHAILPYDATDSNWLEVGDPKRLEAARRFIGHRDEEGKKH